MDTVMLFVYGTLKRGHSNNRFLANGVFEREDEAPGVVYVRGVPVVRPLELGEPERWVKGEVWQLPIKDLAAVDRLEGHSHGYTRQWVTLKSGHGAYIYYWLRDTKYYQEVPDGEFPLHFQRRAAI